MDKKAVVHIHHGVFLSHSKEYICISSNEVEETGADYIQSEVSQKEKPQYSTLTHIYEIQKDGNNNPLCETAKETQMYITVLDFVGEGEGGMI